MQRCSNKAYAMCPTRHLCGPIDGATFTDDSECAAFNRAVEDKPMTNADRFRAMSDDELADRRVGEIEGFLPYSVWFALDEPDKMYPSREEAVEAELTWLQQPAEE